MSQFALFCRNATDSQLREILRKEYNSSRTGDYQTAREEAIRRGWTVRAGEVV